MKIPIWLLGAACGAGVCIAAGCDSNSPTGSNGGSTSGGSGVGSTSGSGSTSSGGSSSGSGSSRGSTSGSGTSGGSGSAGGGSTSGSAVSGSGSTSGSGGNSAGTSSGGCAGGTCLNPNCMPLTTAAPVDMYPGTGFETQPNYIPTDVIIPTLDDVPDAMNTAPAKTPGRWTTVDLQYLDANNLHWDFFMNSNNACGDLSAGSVDATCIAALKDILMLHNPGNHTVHHAHLAGNALDGSAFCADATCVGNELTGVESLINMLSSGARPHLTRFRAPYGEPYQAGTSTFVQPEVAKFAVSIGWNIDSDDSNHDDGTNCIGTCWTGQDVYNKVVSLIGTPGKGSAYGILLMHGIFGWTHDALPLLFDPVNGYMAKNKFKIGTVEDAICWKYGKHSWEIVEQLTGQTRGPN